jgi:hypothetical protein
MLAQKVSFAFDILIGLAVALFPLFLDLPVDRKAHLVFLGFGAIWVVQIFLAKFTKIFPVWVHRTLDIIMGAALPFFPALLGYGGALTLSEWNAHFFSGLGLIIWVGMSRFPTDIGPTTKSFLDWHA